VASCSGNGSSYEGSPIKACAEYSAVRNPSQWEGAIQAGVHSTDAALRTASKKAQTALMRLDVPATITELDKIPQICNALTKGS
jgi:hypothetical protein